MSETPQPNAEAARTPEGTLKDVRETAPPETASSSETTDKSLLNEPDAEAKEPEKAAAPEKYEDFKLPEGFEANPETMKEAGELFKKIGLSQEHAQELVSFYAKVSQAAADAPVDFFINERKGWKDSLTNDPDIGGAKLAATKSTINRAIDSILSKADAAAFREAMDFTGAGDHPAFARAFFKLASLLTETPANGHVPGNGPTKESQSPTGQVTRPSTANALYPNLP